MANENFMSLYGAFKYDGKKINPATPLRQDASTQKIIYIMPGSAMDFYNNETAGYFVECEDDKSLTTEKFFLYPDTLANMAAVSTALATVSSTDTFKLYTSLISIDYKAVDGAPSVIISGDYTQDDRIYNPDADTTTVLVWCKNWLKKKIFLFSGNQTIAGAYTYFS